MKLKTREIAFCGMFAALIAVGAFVKLTIPLPAYDMHFTFQWFFVLMAAFLLGAKLGAISVAVYLLIGLCGVPVFAAGGGPAYVLRPGFGFLLGFLLAAWVMGFITYRFKLFLLWQMLLTATIGLILYYSVGAVYFYLIKNFYQLDTLGFGVIVVDYCLITVIPDFILCVFAVVLAVQLRPVLQKIFAGKARGSIGA